MNARALAVPAALVLALALAACSNGDSPSGVDEETTALLSVVPTGGATGVDPSAPVEVEFGHPMNPAMADFADVHEGDLVGPEVPGSWSWSNDHTRLTFTPDQPLKPRTTYVIHLGGGMMDVDGHPVDFQRHGFTMGGEWATDTMMHEGMMGGGMMGGDPGSQDYHMGPGWGHANGSYGMVFTFTTA